MLLGFKKRFVAPIQIGTKVFTMRGPRKIQPKIGENLYMYYGLRTKFCEKISDKEKLISTQKVEIRIDYEKGKFMSLRIKVDGNLLDDKQKSDFVKYDGFAGQEDFCNWWIDSSTKGNKKKVGCVAGTLHLYHWTDLRF